MTIPENCVVKYKGKQFEFKIKIEGKLYVLNKTLTIFSQKSKGNKKFITKNIFLS